MSSDLAIRFEGVGKEYRVGAASSGGHYRYQSLGERLSGALRNPLRAAAGALRRPDTDSFWALKDVSFDVKRGEVVGVIGRNGAGKSTLLKILSQITRPSEGQIEVHGRVGSLLEVGTGFHPELTGRENVFLNGAILGMTQREVRSKFDEIVSFSEVERFLDTPVKQYSSGMYTRLAFAVAAHLDPEILVVDEVLAVGDAEFQKKCLGKMQDVASGGRTVLFVSHNMGAVQELCDRGCLLSGGQVVLHGPMDTVVRKYMAAGSTVSDVSAAEVKDQKWFGPARILRCGVTQDDAIDTAYFDPTKPIRIYADIEHQAGALLSFGVVIRTAYGLNLLHVTSQDDQEFLVLPESTARLSISIPAIPFSDGEYSIMYFLADRGFQPQHILNDAVTFTVDSSARGQRYASSPIVTPAQWTFGPTPEEIAPQ